MNEVLEKPLVRRFGTADLDKHGGWIMRRMVQVFPNQTERGLAGWLRETVNSNSSLFLYQEHGVALFQVLSVHSLEAKPWVWERFVFAEEGYVPEGAEFYHHAKVWCEAMGINTMIVEQMTDIPHDLIREKLGRLYQRTQVFAKL